ncbi:hypothetical protein MMC22_008168 [Lobaria immixta]|nr:hypothetical protein [Lobaria immixta]
MAYHHYDGVESRPSCSKILRQGDPIKLRQHPVGSERDDSDERQHSIHDACSQDEDEDADQDQDQDGDQDGYGNGKKDRTAGAVHCSGESRGYDTRGAQNQYQNTKMKMKMTLGTIVNGFNACQGASAGILDLQTEMEDHHLVACGFVGFLSSLAFTLVLLFGTNVSAWESRTVGE